ncbi:hypothetical protein GCM10007989_36920 [Devosia pacifica]|uniref:Uncharacterized protein n=1 Tax=Devosia pacifica TaxID=1335967 RepID=A0A918SGS8_9HYPH|nr:hypothetical protein GCM10007989_36920 [Devosia pacifica]
MPAVVARVAHQRRKGRLLHRERQEHPRRRGLPPGPALLQRRARRLELRLHKVRRLRTGHRP